MRPRVGKRWRLQTERAPKGKNLMYGDRPCHVRAVKKADFFLGIWWAVQGSNLRPPACKAGALTS